MCEYEAIRLGDIKENQKPKNQLLFAIGRKLRVETMEYPMTYPLSSEQDLFLNKWELRWCFKFNLIDKMPDGEEKEKERAMFWWSLEEDCFMRVFGHEMRVYLEIMSIATYPEEVIFKKEESSYDELQDSSSSSEEEEENQEEEEGPQEEEKPETAKIEDNESSNSYSSALTTMDWGLRSHPKYQEDYWIRDSGALSHMVGEDKDLCAKKTNSGTSKCSQWHINTHGMQGQDEC